MAPAQPTTLSMWQVNHLPPDALAATLRVCLAAPAWTGALVRGRPYADLDDLLRYAQKCAASLSADDIRAALADHPRIGERPPDRQTASWSTAEQSGVDRRDGRLMERLRTANQDYERRFGHLYLVCAAGRTGTELLADLLTRLDNDPEDEMRVIRDELGKIAQVRLRRLVSA